MIGVREVISPSLVKRDRVEKKEVYERIGVPNYWLIDPRNKNLEIYNRIDDRYMFEDIYIDYEQHEIERLIGLNKRCIN